MNTRITIPSALWDDSRLDVLSREIRIFLGLRGPCTADEIAESLGVHRQTALKGCRKLVTAGWVQLVKVSKRKVYFPTFTHEADRERIEILEVEKGMALYIGEFLMKRLLDLVVSATDYVENARPEFLRVPGSKAPLEYDRFYPRHNVAFEFNGEQHYQATTRYSSETDLEDRQRRDYLKSQISKRMGIQLITVTETDLSVKAIGKLVPASLPRTHVDYESLYVRKLDQICSSYIEHSRA